MFYSRGYYLYPSNPHYSDFRWEIPFCATILSVIGTKQTNVFPSFLSKSREQTNGPPVFLQTAAQARDISSFHISRSSLPPVRSSVFLTYPGGRRLCSLECVGH
jgi:hypothetical protein